MHNSWHTALEDKPTTTLSLSLSVAAQGALRLALIERRKLADDAPDADALLARTLLESVGRETLLAACRAAGIDWPSFKAE